MGISQPQPSSMQEENICHSRNDSWNVRTISPDQISVMSSGSETSVDHSEEGLVQKSRPRFKWLTAGIPQVFKRSRRSRTGTAFEKWKGQQRQSVPRLLLLTIIESVAVMLFASASFTNHALLTSFLVF